MLKDWAKNKVTNASEKIACKVLERKQKVFYSLSFYIVWIFYKINTHHVCNLK